MNISLLTTLVTSIGSFVFLGVMVFFQAKRGSQVATIETVGVLNTQVEVLKKQVEGLQKQLEEKDKRINDLVSLIQGKDPVSAKFIEDGFKAFEITTKIIEKVNYNCDKTDKLYTLIGKYLEKIDKKI